MGRLPCKLHGHGELRLYSTVQYRTVQYTVQVSYVCSSGGEGEELFFEWDRDMAEYNVSCLEGGTWDQPAVWPVCLPCKGSVLDFVLLYYLYY